jgi:hemolysin III
LTRIIREPFCAFSHFAGALLSVAALVYLVIAADGRPWHVVSLSIYGASLIVLYLSSALYHTLPLGERGLRRMQRLDHSAIYVLIAGTYVPVCLVSLRGGWGWSLFGIEYGLAATGILLTLFWKSAPPAVRVLLYILMGWLAVIALGPLSRSLSPEGVFWLVAGGVVYTVGAVIFALDRPHLWPGKFSAHDLWHLFVLGGSACHFACILTLVTA